VSRALNPLFNIFFSIDISNLQKFCFLCRIFKQVFKKYEVECEQLQGFKLLVQPQLAKYFTYKRIQQLRSSLLKLNQLIVLVMIAEMMIVQDFHYRIASVKKFTHAVK